MKDFQFGIGCTEGLEGKRETTVEVGNMQVFEGAGNRFTFRTKARIKVGKHRYFKDRTRVVTKGGREVRRKQSEGNKYFQEQSMEISVERIAVLA